MKVRTPLRVIVIGFFMCSFFTVPIFAHPHLSIAGSEEFVWEKERLTGVWIEWTFDEFFSADIIKTYDVNRDGSFSEAESTGVYKNAFSNLKNYYYFTFIRQGSTRWNPASVSRFSARIDGRKMLYRFFVDLSGAKMGDISLSMYDYTFFCTISIPETTTVTLIYDPAYVSPSFTISENKEYPVYYNPLASTTDTTVYYTWKKGLETYYPSEIRISYKK